MISLSYRISLLLCTASAAALAQPKPLVIDKVVAVVGDAMVMHSDIENQVDQMTMSDVPVTANTRCELVENAMYQKLFLNQARIDSVEVTEEQVNQELESRLRYFVSQIGSEEELEKYYGKSIDQIKDDFRDEVRELLLVQQMQQTVIGIVKVSPAEVREFFASIPKDSLPYIGLQMRLAQIIKQPPASAAEQQAVIDKLKDIKMRVENGEDFGALAYLYSADPGSAERNGELGFTNRDELVPEFSSAAGVLEKNQVSDVVKTQFGYHLIQMIDRKGDRINVRHILLIPQVSAADLQVGKLKLDSIKAALAAGDSLTFEQLAQRHSDDVESRMSGGEIRNPASGSSLFDMETLGAYDRNLMLSVQRLKVGEVSNPELFQTADGKRAFRIVKLVEQVEPHVASIETDYQRLSDSAARRKENLQLEQWLTDHCRDAYVYIDPSFATCQFKTAWQFATR